MTPEQDPVSGKFVQSGVVETQPVQAAPVDNQPAQPQPPEQPQPQARLLSEDEAKNMLVEITVNGQSKTVPLDEARQGYMRTAAFTQNMQALSERERQLSMGGVMPQASGVQPGFVSGQQYAAPGGYGVWPTSQPSPAAPPYEQPYGGPTATPGATPPLKLEDDDYITGAQMQQIMTRNDAQRQYERQMLAQTNEQLQIMQQQQAEQRAVGSLAARYPGFDESLVEQNIYSLPPDEQQRLQTLPRPLRLEMAHLQIQQMQAATQPQTQTQPQSMQSVNQQTQGGVTQSAGATVPHSETERRFVPPANQPLQKLTGPQTQDRATATNYGNALVDMLPVLTE